MNQGKKKSAVLKGMLLSAAGIATALTTSVVMAAPTGQAVVRTKCQACHAPLEAGGWSRISESRRTPEGWDMTVARMMYSHGVKLTAPERQAVVKYLADTQGLAPDETSGYRYALERRSSVVEHFDNQKVGETCARCHSYSRIALQRRSEDDWRRLSHFHVGQFPVIEIQAGGRDRDWWEIASKEVPALLGKEKPLVSKSWEGWKKRGASDASGVWRVSGHRPGVGDYEGKATIKALGEDRYDIELTMQYGDGRVEKSTGTSVIYTGYEWRGAVKQGGIDVRQVFALTADGNHMSGRWFATDTEALGGDFSAIRVAGQTEILSVSPTMIKAGETAKITINGVGLNGDVKFDNGVTVNKILSRTDEKVVVEIKADASANTAYSVVSIGSGSLAKSFAVYKKIDFVDIVPGNPMARVGGNGGTRPKVPVQLEAIAYSAGADGKKNTADDIRLGPVSANWKIGNLNKGAEEMKDAKYAGVIDGSGLFSPADAGPNPNRKYGTNNAGELRAFATVKDGASTVNSSVPLVVTVQRWNDPPIY